MCRNLNVNFMSEALNCSYGPRLLFLTWQWRSVFTLVTSCACLPVLAELEVLTCLFQCQFHMWMMLSDAHLLSLSSRWASVSVSLLWQSVQQERRPEDAHPHPHTSKWQGFSNFCVYKLFVYSPLLLTAALFNHGCISWTRLDTIWWFRCTEYQL